MQMAISAHEYHNRPAEEFQRHDLFYKALFNLQKENKFWWKNYCLFKEWTPQWREHWIKHVERQAPKGAVIAAQVMAEVVRLRLLS